jgi:hypothetical protein
MAAGGGPSSGFAQWFGGTAMDTDLDGVLDCADNCPADSNAGQEDCDGDGLGDLCAIASGTAMDANSNGLPDECEGSSYCTGKINSLGCVPSMSSAGFASATSATSFEVTASDCLPNQIGLLLYGYASSNLSFHGGTLCVNTPKAQFPAQIACTQVYVQWRQRDPNDSAGFGDSLTNGLTFSIQP